jgi:hypothetical protein
MIKPARKKFRSPIDSYADAHYIRHVGNQPLYRRVKMSQSIDVSAVNEMAHRLEDISLQIQALVREAAEILTSDKVVRPVWDQARPYWYATLQSALGRDNEWIGGPMVKMGDTIDALRELAYEMDAEEWEEDE